MKPPPDSKSYRPTEITVRVLLFSVLRERLGASEINVSLQAGRSTDDLLRKLIETYPDVRSYADVTKLAVNEEYVEESVALVDGDEVALITPVSGG